MYMAQEEGLDSTKKKKKIIIWTENLAAFTKIQIVKDYTKQLAISAGKWWEPF